MRVLISGAGIAGLSLGLCLSEKGHDVVICERSPALRTTGYMLDFFGPGYEAAGRLGLLPSLQSIHRPVKRNSSGPPCRERRPSAAHEMDRPVPDGGPPRPWVGDVLTGLVFRHSVPFQLV